MFVCKSCGEKFDAPVKFCNKCGSSMIEPEVATYSAGPAYGAPSAPTSPAGKILGIISMVCGITGAFFAFIAFVVSCVALDEYYMAGVAMFYAIFFAVFGVAAMVLSSMSRNKGFNGGMASAGKVLGLVSIIICGIALLFSLIALA